MHHNRAEYQQARSYAERMLHLAQHDGSPTQQVWAHLLLAQVLYQAGEIDPARKYFLYGMAFYDPQRHSPSVSDVAHDPRVHCLAQLAEVLWLLGYPAQALQYCQEALSMAQRLAHPYSRVVALATAVQVHSWRGEHQAALELAEELIAMAHAHGFPHWLAVGLIRQGRTVAAQGHPEAGIALIRQGLAALQATGAQVWLPVFFGELAWAHGVARQAEAGLALIAEALTRVQATGEHQHAAELYRLKGELLLMREGTGHQAKGDKQRLAKAEVCFRKATRIARSQKARSLQLRAGLSLSRLWQQQDKAQPARQMLARVYSWFTEGFDTADLRQAKALLDALT
jgi:predicted ATPase